MNGVDILMAPAVNARNFGSASLAVHEVDCLPDAVEPGVISNTKGASHCISCFDHIPAWLAHPREIQHLIVTQRSAGLLDRFGQNDLAGLWVNHRKLGGC